MRAQFTTINGEKIAITHIDAIRQGVNTITFKANGWMSMELYINDELLMEAGELHELKSNIDSQMILSEDKE
jgi:hypothetical protein